MTDGVDYSRTPDSNWEGIAAALKAGGKSFVWRYAVSDLAPAGRGISAPEYHALRSAGLDVGLYWEGAESWMLGGFTAGQNAARNAEACIAQAGMPAAIPIYFAHDIDPSPAHWAAIDACLNGAAAVIGWERVGVYGGWALIDYMASGGTVKLLCQTSAWEYGRGLHPAATLYQFAYNQYFNGVNCDLVRAVKPAFGQASLYEPKPQPAPTPKPSPVPGIALPPGLNLAMLGRLYTGSSRNQVVIAGETVSFTPTGPVSRAWLQRGLASIPAGKTWREGTFPRITDRVRRGVDGKDGVDWVFSDGSSIHQDPPKAGEKG